MGIIFWEFLLLYQICFSPQVQRSVIISNKHGIYEFPDELQKHLGLRILGSYERSRKSKKFICHGQRHAAKTPNPHDPAPVPAMYTQDRKKHHTKRKFITIYARSTLHEKTELLQERQIWLGRLSIPLCKLL